MFAHRYRHGRLLGLTLFVGLGIVVAACTGSSSTQSTEGEAGTDSSDTTVAQVDAESPDGAIVVQALTNDATAPARVNNFSEAAESLNEKLEEEGSDDRVSVEAIIKPMGDDEYNQQIIFASQSGNAADIYATGYTRVGWMADADYIQPIDDIADAAVFDDLLEGYWQPVTYKGQIWGVIQDTEARGVLYNKDVLRELGWSDEEIENLPERVEAGEFLLEDMTAVARQAVEEGITEYGIAHTSGGGEAKADLAMLYAAHGAEYYNDETNEFILDRDPMLATFEWVSGLVEDGVLPEEGVGTPKIDLLADMMNGRSLFVTAGIWDEAKFRTRGIHDEFGNADEQWVLDHIGITLMPPVDSSMRPVTLSNPWVYVVSSDANNLDLVERLLVEVSAPELQAAHGVESAHIPFTQSGQEQPAIQENAWLNLVGYMINYSQFMPKDPDTTIYGDLMTEVFGAVETGGLSPSEGVDWLEDEMERRLENVDVR